MNVIWSKKIWVSISKIRTQYLTIVPIIVRNWCKEEIFRLVLNLIVILQNMWLLQFKHKWVL